MPTCPVLHVCIYIYPYPTTNEGGTFNRLVEVCLHVQCCMYAYIYIYPYPTTNEGGTYNRLVEVCLHVQCCMYIYIYIYILTPQQMKMALIIDWWRYAYMSSVACIYIYIYPYPTTNEDGTFNRLVEVCLHVQCCMYVYIYIYPYSTTNEDGTYNRLVVVHLHGMPTCPVLHVCCMYIYIYISLPHNK